MDETPEIDPIKQAGLIASIASNQIMLECRIAALCRHFGILWPDNEEMKAANLAATKDYTELQLKQPQGPAAAESPGGE